MQSFHDAVSWHPRDGVPATHIEDNWRQGRTVFGGVTAAAGATAMAAVVAPDRRLRTLYVQFIAPATGPLTADARVLRSGRTVTHSQVTLHSGDTLIATLIGTYGVDRPRSLALPPPQRPSVPPPDEGHVLRYVPGVVPAHVQNFDVSLVAGGAPFTGAKVPGMTGWARHRTPAHGAPGVIGLMDVWPAPVVPMLTRPVPASTVSWTLHLVAPPHEDVTGWWLYDNEAVTASDGFCTMRARLFAPEGHLAAWSEQLVAVFDG